jgi:hypothetical protein
MLQFRLLLLVSGICFAALASPSAAADASWMNEAQQFHRWCERPAKSVSFGLSEGKQDLLVKDIHRKLKQLKVYGAKVQVVVEPKHVTVLVNYTYPSPERYVLRREYNNGILTITERVDSAWQVYIVAEKGKLLKSHALPISKTYTY